MALAPCPDCASQVSTIAAACPNCGHPFAARSTRVLAKPDWLFGLMCVSVLLGTGGMLSLEAIRSAVRPLVAKPMTLTSASYATADRATFIFTNLTDVPGYACVKGVVASKADKTARVETVPVCTGELKPHSTIELVAIYPKGDVRDICTDPPDRLGLRQMNWSLCTFDSVDLTVAPPM